MFRKILIANRGEIALRIIKTCKLMGIKTVAVFSTADKDSPHLKYADETVCLGGPRSKESYLNMRAILQAAIQHGCQAIHPGYGFLAENALFARLCEQQKTTFIGPPPTAISLMGDKIAARTTMAQAGLDPIPGSYGALKDINHALAEADRIGYPVMIKAKAGGGGKGMRRCEDPATLRINFPNATLEAEKAFGDGSLYMEKFIQDGRHIEFQILADVFGHAVHLGERECSVQRNHQKLIEESPSPAITAELRARIGSSAAQAAVAAGYYNAGTMEFLLDAEGRLYFMEMNTRLQVEHPVTEMVTGLDLVKEQLLIAANCPLSFTQEQIVFKGHAIECRINAENPFDGFKGSPGAVTRLVRPPTGNGSCRLDTHIEDGAVIPPFYDSMIAKLIGYGEDRPAAIAALQQALSAMVIEGVYSTLRLHQLVLATEEFTSGNYNTGLIPRFMATTFTAQGE